MNTRREPSPGGAPIDFSIDVEPQHDTVNIIPTGELDIATVGQLQNELDDLIGGGFARIVIDLRGVEFIDSTGLHLLLSVHERAGRQGWQLSIVPGRHAVQQVFEITGTIARLPFTPSTNGAGNSDRPDTPLPHRPDGTELVPRVWSQALAHPTSPTDPDPR